MALLASLAVGVSRTSETPGLATRYGLAGAYWLTSALGAGFEATGFSNISSFATDNIGCQSPRPCYSGDPRNRSGWLLEPRFLLGRRVSIVRFYAAFGLGLAREDVPSIPSRSYFAIGGSLEGAASVDLGRFSFVPTLRIDAMDGAAAALLKLSVGVNL